MNIRGSKGSSLVSRANAAERREENVVPMINVIFLLLLYFMIAGNLTPDSDSNVVPPVSASESELPRNVLEVVIDAQGQITAYGQQIPVGSLGQKLLVDGVPPETIRIKADTNTDAVVLTDVIDTLAQIGVKELILVTIRAG